MNDREKVAFTSGFSAAWEYRMGNGKDPVNPYSLDEDANLYNRWQEGFDSYNEHLM